MYIGLHTKYLLFLSDVSQTKIVKVLDFYCELFPILRFLNIPILINSVFNKTFTYCKKCFPNATFTNILRKGEIPTVHFTAL